MSKVLSKVYVTLILVFLYAPILVLIVFSFNESKSRSNFTNFTLKWYKELFHNDLIMTSLWNTLKVAVMAAILATILGTFAALGMNAMKKRARSVCMNITYMPVINPEIVTGISMMLLFVFFCTTINNLFGKEGQTLVELGFWSVLIAHVTFCVPYVVLNVLPKLRQMDQNLYEAALDLGCNPLKSFFLVIIPEILSGITAGFLMAFTFSLDDFVITYFTNGPTFQTLPVTIYSMTRKKVNPQINALSALLFVVVLLLLIVMNIKQAKDLKAREEK
jgi:spermidine/putrescine transport system permease protein